MSVFKCNTGAKRGTRDETKNFYIRFRDHEHRVRRVAAFPSKRESELLEQVIESLVACRCVDAHPTPEQMRKIQLMPRKVYRRLVKFGIIEKSWEAPDAGQTEVAALSKPELTQPQAQLLPRAESVAGVELWVSVSDAIKLTGLPNHRIRNACRDGLINARMVRKAQMQDTQFLILPLSEVEKFAEMSKRVPKGKQWKRVQLRARIKEGREGWGEALVEAVCSEFEMDRAAVLRFWQRECQHDPEFPKRIHKQRAVVRRAKSNVVTADEAAPLLQRSRAKSQRSPAKSQPSIIAPRLLNMHQVCALTGFTRVHITNLANTGRMPKPLKIGRSIRWRASDIDAWIDAGCPSVEAMKGT